MRVIQATAVTQVHTRAGGAHVPGHIGLPVALAGGGLAGRPLCQLARSSVLSDLNSSQCLVRLCSGEIYVEGVRRGSRPGRQWALRAVSGERAGCHACLRNCPKRPAWLAGRSALSPLCSGPCLDNRSHPSPWIGPAGLRRAVGAGEHEMLLVWLGDPVLPRTAPSSPEAARGEHRHSARQN